MTDDDFDELLRQYLEPPADPNPTLAGVQLVWVDDHPDFGLLHIQEQHDVSRQEVEQVLLQIPPLVEARRHRADPNRTVFWGATQADRWLIVVCEDWTEAGTRFLKPITAFEPDEGEAYWRRQ